MLFVMIPSLVISFDNINIILVHLRWLSRQRLVNSQYLDFLIIFPICRSGIFRFWFQGHKLVYDFVRFRSFVNILLRSRVNILNRRTVIL